MFDVGFSELVLIALLALIVLGPKRLPEMARTAGRWMAKIRHFVANVKQDFDRGMRNAELTELHQLKQELDETRRLMEDTSGRLMQQISAIPSEETPAVATAPKFTSSSPSAELSPSPKAAPTQEPASKNPRKRSHATPVTKRPHGRSGTPKRTKHV